MTETEAKQVAEVLRTIATRVEAGDFDDYEFNQKLEIGHDPRMSVTSIYPEQMHTDEETIKIELHRNPNILFGGVRPVRK